MFLLSLTLTKAYAEVLVCFILPTSTSCNERIFNKQNYACQLACGSRLLTIPHTHTHTHTPCWRHCRWYRFPRRPSIAASSRCQSRDHDVNTNYKDNFFLLDWKDSPCAASCICSWKAFINICATSIGRKKGFQVRGLKDKFFKKFRIFTILKSSTKNLPRKMLRIGKLLIPNVTDFVFAVLKASLTGSTSITTNLMKIKLGQNGIIITHLNWINCKNREILIIA